MQTKSIKRARRVGRKRQQGVEREPNGRAQRSAAADRRETLSVALGARVRHGLAGSIDEARDPRCATLLGRLERDGKITREQRTAGELYAQRRRQHAAAIAAPPDYPPAPGERGSGPGMAADDARRAIDQWLAANDALIHAGRASYLAVVAAALEDRDEGSLEALRFGLLALQRHFDWA